MLRWCLQSVSHTNFYCSFAFVLAQSLPVDSPLPVILAIARNRSRWYRPKPTRGHRYRGRSPWPGTPVLTRRNQCTRWGDHELVFTGVEAVNWADFDAAHVFAANTVLGDHIGHFLSLPRSKR